MVTNNFDPTKEGATAFDPTQYGASPIEEKGILPTIKKAGNFMLGSAMNVAKDVGAGLSAKKQLDYLDKREQEATNLEKQALATKDVNKKSYLVKQAQIIRDEIGESSKNITGSFSPDVDQNPLWRGLKTGSEIAATAELPQIVSSVVKGVPSVIKGAGKILTKPAGAVKSVIQYPLKGSAGKAVGKLAEEATEEGAKIGWDKPLEEGGEVLVDEIKKRVFEKFPATREIRDAFGKLISSLTPTPETEIVGQVGQAKNLPMIKNISLNPTELLKYRTQLQNSWGSRIFNYMKGGSDVDMKVAGIARNVISETLHGIAPKTLSPDKALAIYHKLGPLGHFGILGVGAELLLGKAIYNKLGGLIEKAAMVGMSP